MSVQTPRSDHGQALDALLADGEWHERESLIVAVMPSVPPGLAFRWAEAVRAKNRRRRGVEQGDRVHHTTHDAAVRSGARALTVESIRQRRRNGTIEQRTRNGVVEIRRAP